jgi:hypothetical protein
MTDRERVEQEIEEAAKKLAPTEYDAPTIKGIKAALFAERVRGFNAAKRRVIALIGQRWGYEKDEVLFDMIRELEEPI